MYLKLLIWVLVNYQYLRNTTSVNEQIRFSKIYDYELDILKANEFNETDDTICDDILRIIFSTIVHVLRIIFL
jgi:hypothetical protein